MVAIPPKKDPLKKAPAAKRSPAMFAATNESRSEPALDAAPDTADGAELIELVGTVARPIKLPQMPGDG